MANGNVTQSDCVVYWLFDATCICPWRHGYVGISERWVRRLWRHRREERFSTFEWMILFRGTREQCLELEARMRPTWGIGWNLFEGGRAGGTAPKSKSQREKMRQASLDRWSDLKKREEHSERCKEAFESIDRAGPNNGHFGKNVSDQGKKNISLGRVGKGIGNQNWRKRGPYSQEALRKMSEASKCRWSLQTKEK